MYYILVVIVVFDLADESTLSNAEKWMIDACENASEPCKFLVGTKKDLLVCIHLEPSYVNE